MTFPALAKFNQLKQPIMKVETLMRLIDEMLYAGEITPDSEIIVAAYKSRQDDEAEEQHISDLNFGRAEWIWDNPDEGTKCLELRAYEN